VAERRGGKRGKQETFAVALTSELAVDVAANFERRLQLQQNGLREENFTRLEAQAANLGLRHLNWFSWPTSPNFEQSCDQIINIQLDLRHIFPATRKKQEAHAVLPS